MHQTDNDEACVEPRAPDVAVGEPPSTGYTSIYLFALLSYGACVFSNLLVAVPSNRPDDSELAARNENVENECSVWARFREMVTLMSASISLAQGALARLLKKSYPTLTFD